MLIRYVRRVLNHLGRHSVKVPVKGTAPRLRPRFEVLEDRTLLDAYHWVNPVSGNWNTASNWENSHVPVAGDTAIIDATGANYTVTLDINPTVDGFTLNSANATFSASSRTMTVNGPATLSAGTVLWTSSTWTGTGTLTNSASMTLQSATINAPLVNQGLLVFQGTANVVGGSLSNQASGTLRLLGPRRSTPPWPSAVPAASATPARWS
jgi:hypothetical protein